MKIQTKINELDRNTKESISRKVILDYLINLRRTAEDLQTVEEDPGEDPNEGRE